jgi:hypothetical protein
VSILTKDYVANLLEYNPETGELRRKISRSSNARVGQIVGTIRPDGYLSVMINGCRYQAHRVAWLLAHGEWPDDVVDHVNGIKTDNRISNLRACSQSENVMNAKTRSNNTSGVKGVCWHKAKNAWHASVCARGRRVFGGYHKNLEDAKRAVMSLREQLHREFSNHGDRESAASAE